MHAARPIQDDPQAFLLLRSEAPEESRPILIPLRSEQRTPEGPARRASMATTAIFSPSVELRVKEFQELLSSSGAEPAVYDLMSYLNDKARSDGMVFLRLWLQEALTVRFADELRLGVLAILRPVRTELAEYVKYLEDTRRQLRETRDESSVNAMLWSYGV